MEIVISKAQHMLPRLIRLARQGEVIILTQGQHRIPVVRLEVLVPAPPGEMQNEVAHKKPLSNEEPAS